MSSDATYDTETSGGRTKTLIEREADLLKDIAQSNTHDVRHGLREHFMLNVYKMFRRKKQKPCFRLYMQQCSSGLSKF